MTALSDTLTVSLVLVLLFGSIALYLYTRIQQAEQRINLLDSIVLELKMSSEVKSYTELPANDYDTDFHSTNHSVPTSNTNVAEYKPFDESEEADDDSVSQASSLSSKHSVQQTHQQQQQQETTESLPAAVTEVDDVEFYKSVLDSQSESTSKSTKVNVSYESMNIKELHILAKQRGITGATVMKKQAIIDTLKAQDKGSSPTVEPGSIGSSSLGSFLETSAFLGQQNETGAATATKTLTIDDE